MKKIAFPSRRFPWGFAKTASGATGAQKGTVVKYVDFNLTGRCQAGCITCPAPRSYADEKTNKSQADLEEELERFKAYFARLKKLGLEFVTIYGREPLLWDREIKDPNKYLRQLIVWLSDGLKVKVCLATSGIIPQEGVFKTLFDHQGILFMKDWGSRNSVEKLVKNKQAYVNIRRSWALVRKLAREYKKARVVAEFLYTGINRGDLFSFWRRCFKNGFIPFVEVPVIKGDCVRNYRLLNIRPLQYVKDIYELSLLNLSLRYGLDKRSSRQSGIWEPPFGSIFPSPCDKLTGAKGLFLERNGDLRFCCGVDKLIGNIMEQRIGAKLRAGILIKKARNAYNNLSGYCGHCDYSRKLRACYGCRGNAYTYPGREQGVFSSDPLCFGRLAAELAAGGKLSGVISQEHIKKILTYFTH